MTSIPGKTIVYRRDSRPTLRAVASKAGVSHTAVAMALRDDSRLSPELRQHIRRVAQEEGYVLEAGASTGTVGVIVPHLRSPYVSLLADSIVQALWEQDGVPLVLCSELDIVQEERLLQTLAGKRVAGVIIMPAREDRTPKHFVHLLQRHTPILAVNNPLPQIQAPWIGGDDDLGATVAVRHLLEQGHRRILHLGGSVDNAFADTRREDAYVRAMRQAGLEPQVIRLPNRVIWTDEVVPLIQEYLGSAEGRRTTAIFAFNDPAAYCVYVAAPRAGRTVGRDLAVVGFGNVGGRPPGVPNLSDILHPSLSTVEQFPTELGRVAVQTLGRLMSERPVPNQTLIKPELIVRESSRWLVQP